MPSHLQRLQLADQGYEGLRRLRVQDSICIHLKLCLADGLDTAHFHLHTTHARLMLRFVPFPSTAEDRLWIQLVVRRPTCSCMCLHAG